MNKDFFSKERFKYIIILALFNYIFLGTEYLFDNIVGDIKPQSVVTAQSYILGASVLGFLFFAIIKKYINKMNSIHNAEKEKIKGAVINNIVTIIFALCTNIIGKIVALLKRLILAILAVFNPGMVPELAAVEDTHIEQINSTEHNYEYISDDYQIKVQEKFVSEYRNLDASVNN